MDRYLDFRPISESDKRRASKAMGKAYEPTAPSEYAVTPVVAVADSLFPHEADSDGAVSARLDTVVWSNTAVNSSTATTTVKSSRGVEKAVVASTSPPMTLAPPPTTSLSDLQLPAQQESTQRPYVDNDLPKTPIVTCSESPYGSHSGNVLANRAKRRKECAVMRPGWEVDVSGRGTNKTLRISGCTVGFSEDKALKDIVTIVVIEVRLSLMLFDCFCVSLLGGFGVGASQGVIVEDFIVHVLPALKPLSRVTSLTLSGFGCATVGVLRDVCKRLPNSLQNLTIVDLPASPAHRNSVIHSMPRLLQLNGIDITEVDRANASSMCSRLFQVCNNAAVVPSVGVGLGGFPSSTPVLFGCEVTASPPSAATLVDSDAALIPSPKKGAKPRKATNGGGVVISQPSFAKLKLSSVTDNTWLTGLHFPAAFNCVDTAIRATNVTVDKLSVLEACWGELWASFCETALKKSEPYVANDSLNMLDLEDVIVQLGCGK